jgi:hypothetical protein
MHALRFQWKFKKLKKHSRLALAAMFQASPMTSNILASSYFPAMSRSTLRIGTMRSLMVIPRAGFRDSYFSWLLLQWLHSSSAVGVVD